jgi:4-hydroxy-4-methyl-2-oxoglutarate aldolase
MHAPGVDHLLLALCDRLTRLSTAVVSDVLFATGFADQVLKSDIRAIAPSRPFAGPAVCLLGKDGPEPGPMASGSKPVFEIDRHMTKGCVAVIATGGHKVGAVIGGNVALSWNIRGCAGVVTDGGIRDADECNRMGLPVFATFVGPMSNKGLWAFVDMGIPIMLPGQRGNPVVIRPGDIVHADTDGVVIIPATQATQVVLDSEVLEQVEEKVRTDLKRGEDREAVYKRHDRFGHIKKATVG